MESVLSAREAGRQRALVSSPTGTGKTVSFVALHNQWPVSGKTLVLAHREELLSQAAASFQRADPRCWIGIEAAGSKAGPMADIVVASVQTVGRPQSTRLAGIKFSLVICDEAHHACAPSYRNAFQRFGCFEPGGPFLCGVTATPTRLDQKRLIPTVFEEHVFRYELADAIADGWLCDIRGYRVATKTSLEKVRTTAGDYNAADLERAVDVEERTGAAIQHWRDVAGDRPTIVFCAGVDHAEHVARAFRDTGIAAACVSGRLDGEDRRAAIERFRSGEMQVLANVDILTEGFDHPPTSCILMMRPTQSWTVYVQAVGRGTRLHPGKSDLVVIDVVDNHARHDLATVPAMLGLPSDLDLQGKSLAAAAGKLAAIGDQVEALKGYQPRLFSDIETLLQQVDLFKRAAVTPPEVRAGNCKLAWQLLSDGSYYVSCGGERQREARLARDAETGAWILTMAENRRTVKRGPAPFAPGSPVSGILFLSDKVVRRTWPDAERLAAEDADWRTRPASERQAATLRRYGVAVEIIQELTAGQASALISQRGAEGVLA